MIGIDIEKISRFSSWTEEEFNRIFSENEIKYANSFKNNLEHFCGFYCVKEALVKALDNTSLNFKEIEVLHTETGKPYINKTPYIKSMLKKQRYSILNVSISHTDKYATAIVELH